MFNTVSHRVPLYRVLAIGIGCLPVPQNETEFGSFLRKNLFLFKMQPPFEKC
jgi:hypothetical protein